MKTGTKTNIILQSLVLVIGIVLMLIKFWAWQVTDSNSIFTDAAESIVNVVAGVFAICSLFLSIKPKDLNHPYGHGKIEFISAAFEGGLIVLAGVGIWLKTIYDFFNPHTIARIDFGIMLVVLAGLINYLMGWILSRQGKKTNTLIMSASGAHLKADAYSSLALIIGLALLQLTNWIWLDNLVALLFGSFILYTGYKLVRKAVSGIMDEADYELVEQLIQSVNDKRRDNWIDIHNFRVIKYGSDLHIDCHMTLPWYFNTKEAHSEVDAFEDIVNEISPDPVELFIHVDPCESNSCKICKKEDCPMRKFDFIKRVDWALENVIRDERHT